MKKATNALMKKPFAQRRTFPLAIVILNVALLAFAAFAYVRYTSAYQERLWEENLGNVANLNQSSSLNATALVSSWDVKLEDLIRFASKRDLTTEEALTIIEQSNSSENRQFELIGSDYTGYLARRDENGAFSTLSYATSAYADLQKAFDDVLDTAYKDICFAPEFTDGHTALKYFAIYRHLPLRNAAGEMETYTLLLTTRSEDVLAAFNSLNGFEGQSTVLVDASGNYIVSNRDFKSANFFQYLYVYNDLSLSERNEIADSMRNNGSGELYYRDAMGRDCVFRFDRMTTNDWYCVTCVPLSSFRTPVFSINYVVYAVAALLLLLVLDVGWLLHMNARMRISMQREKEASEAKTDFLSRMSHDIRTPLNGIIGLTTLALDAEVNGETREYLENIRVSGQFLSGLVNDILDLSKVESGKVELKPEPYTNRDLFKYIEAVVTPLCREKNQEFRLSEPSDAPPVLLDRLRFNQILFNLLSNAVKYTPEGGRIELYWTHEVLSEGRVALVITVRDNGIGMSEEFQKHMFESFTQEHAQTANTGSGLGLTIVKSLVKLMNGTISVTSKLGEGTEFTVRLQTSVCPDAVKDDNDAVVVTLAGRRVLLCEDNAINTMVAERMLTKWGVSVDVATNGRAGVEAFSASPVGGYDAILMDVMMPVMNGMDATRLIRGMDRPDAEQVPIIAMTANAYDTDVQNCIAAGMDAHMGKPVDQEQLQTLLSEWIGRTRGQA